MPIGQICSFGMDTIRNVGWVRARRVGNYPRFEDQGESGYLQAVCGALRDARAAVDTFSRPSDLDRVGCRANLKNSLRTDVDADAAPQAGFTVQHYISVGSQLIDARQETHPLPPSPVEKVSQVALMCR